MLRELHLSALGVIDDATLELAPGLTALTGETGAGKTMVTTGLGLLLGGRGDAGLVRRGSPRAVVEGRFVPGDTLDAARLDEVGAELDGDELLVARQITEQGRSRAFLGGAQSTVAALAEVTAELATIHGQSEQVRLGSSDRQREVLDRACGGDHLRALAEHQRLFAERRALQTELTELTTHAQERAREADLLRFGLDEIEQVAPQAGEDVALAAQFQRLQATDDLRALAHRVQLALSGDEYSDDQPAAVALTGEARKGLAQLADLDPAAADLFARGVEVAGALNELAADVSGYLADLQADPAELERVVARQADLARLTRKYGSTVDEVIEWSRQQAIRLLGLEDSDGRAAELTERIATLTDQLDERAARLTAARRARATTLADLVQTELAALAMPHARLCFEIIETADLHAHGRDQVQLTFSANPGSALAPLARTASGGELSRVRLALEVVLASDEAGHTFVFDEVDAGVGGAVGLEIGRRLAALATRSQVVVVTHLAQVAAFADRHLVVRKASDGQVTSSDVAEVTGDQRLRELARMMGGLEEASSALAHARDLLAEAAR
ncbi:DNA repair protein RecN [Aestuariimicrobium soli]|uniref:DNA repair protein RecN n=1 Tax=Aestuariimicrobium soli TaxID=2035834 RepID=UPI003EBBCE45